MSSTAGTIRFDGQVVLATGAGSHLIATKGRVVNWHQRQQTGLSAAPATPKC